jgi:hypothetical protein
MASSSSVSAWCVHGGTATSTSGTTITLDRSWTWYEILDGGYSDPAAYLLIGVDHDNNVHVVSGFRKKGLKAKRIKEMRDVKRGGLDDYPWLDRQR